MFFEGLWKNIKVLKYDLNWRFVYHLNGIFDNSAQNQIQFTIPNRAFMHKKLNALKQQILF
jgi:hypothetical protein